MLQKSQNRSISMKVLKMSLLEALWRDISPLSHQIQELLSKGRRQSVSGFNPPPPLVHVKRQINFRQFIFANLKSVRLIYILRLFELTSIFFLFGSAITTFPRSLSNNGPFFTSVLTRSLHWYTNKRYLIDNVQDKYKYKFFFNSKIWMKNLNLNLIFFINKTLLLWFQE